MARLLVLRGEILDREVELKSSTIRLGRGPANDVQLEDEGKSVSRHHAELRHEGGRYVLVDLQSQNGLWVSGRKVRQVTLEPNVVASIGPYRLMVESESVSAPAADPHDAETYVVTRPAAQKPAARDSGATARSGSTRRLRSSWFSRQPKWLLPAAASVIVGIAALVVVLALRSGPDPAAENAALMENRLNQASSLIQTGDCAGALSQHIDPVLAADPSNARALELKTRADDCIRAATPADPPPPPPPTGPTQEEIAFHLQEAGKLIGAGSCAIALVEHIDIVLASQPTHEDALKLKARADACPAPVTTSPVGELARYIPPEKGGLATLPGEIQRDYTARIQAMKKRYDEAVGFFSSGAYQRADQAFTAIVRDASDRYLEAGKLLLQSKENLRQSALKIYADARELESRSEWDKAIQELRRAHETSADVAVDLDIERVVGKKTVLGEKRCAEGRANYAVRQNAVALQAYEEALRLLPPEHKCVAEAKERVAALKK